MDISQKKFGSAYAQSPRKCSNIEILAKIEGKEAKFFLKIYEGHTRILFRSKKNSKLSHACVPLSHEISYSSTVQLLYTVKEKGGKPDRNHNPPPYGLRNPNRNLKSENPQDYAQKPQRNHTFMNSDLDKVAGGMAKQVMKCC